MANIDLDFEVKGVKQLNAALAKLVNALPPEKAEPVFYRAADLITQEARANAPRGKTGNAKRAPVTKQLSRIGNRPASAISAIDRGAAPHWHLIEYGTAPRYQKKSGKYVGSMPANPVFRRAKNKKQNEVVSAVVDGLSRLIEEAIS